MNSFSLAAMRHSFEKLAELDETELKNGQRYLRAAALAGLAAAAASPFVKSPVATSIVGGTHFGSTIVGALKARDLAQEHYGKDWEKGYMGRPGSFLSHHPILSYFLPGAVPISAWRGADHWARVARNLPKERKSEKHG